MLSRTQRQGQFHMHISQSYRFVSRYNKQALLLSSSISMTTAEVQLDTGSIKEWNLPPGWEAFESEKDNRVYYWNKKTGITTWNFPDKEGKMSVHEYQKMHTSHVLNSVLMGGRRNSQQSSLSFINPKNVCILLSRSATIVILKANFVVLCLILFIN